MIWWIDNTDDVTVTKTYTIAKAEAGGTGATGTAGTNGATGATGTIGSTGATGPVAGSNTQVIFNDANAAGASANLTFDKITNQRLTLSRNFIDLINPIISDYALQNSISLVIQKKNILVGKSELDITEKILLIVNKKIIKIKN